MIDSWTGYIESARAVSFMCRLAGGEGVDVREQSAVAGVQERAGRVDIALDGGQRAGFDRIVVAVGVWIGRLLPDIGRHVRVTHQEMLLIEPADPGQFVAGAMPVWSVDPDREGWYGFPVLRGGYAKVAIDPPGDTVDPDLDRSGTPEFEERALAFLERRIPDLARGRGSGRAARVSTPPRRTTTSSSTGPRGARVSSSREGGSGHGFKFGGGIGPVIADAVEDAHNPLGDRFRIGNRFDLPEHGRPQIDRGYARPADAS